MSKNAEMYEAIATKITEMLDNGVIPWRKTWEVGVNAPRNIVSKKAYRGVNVWLLAFNSYTSPWWGTFNQISGLKGKIKKGEKATKVYFYSFGKRAVIDETTKKPKLDENGKPMFSKFPIIKEYNVFNAEQCTDLKIPAMSIVAKTEKEKIESCEKIVAEYENAPEISHIGDKACYIPSMDAIRMPKFDQFHTSENYYSVLFHEMSHSTGHQSRLKRDGIVNYNGFGSHSYGREELVAEFSASYLCAVAGIENQNLENSVAYIQSWKNTIKADPAMVMICASQAQKSADHILGIKPEAENED